MDKIDARKLPQGVLRALRRQAMRPRRGLGLPWREIDRVMGLNATTVFGWAQRYAAEDEPGLVSKKPGRFHLSGRTLTLPQEWGLRTILTTQAHSTRDLSVALWNRLAMRDFIKMLVSTYRSAQWASASDDHLGHQQRGLGAVRVPRRSSGLPRRLSG